MKKLIVVLVAMGIIGSIQAVSSGGYTKTCDVNQSRSPHTYSYTQKIMFHGKRTTRYCYVTISKKTRQKIIDKLYELCKTYASDPQRTYVHQLPHKKGSNVDKVLIDFVQVSQFYTIADVIKVLERNNNEELSPSGTVE